MSQLNIAVVDNLRLAGVGVERADGCSLEGQRHREGAEHTVRGHVLGIIRPPLLAPHVIDEEHLSGQAGVHTRSVPALVLQLVGIQRHLSVIGSRRRLLSPDQRDRSCRHAGHSTPSDPMISVNTSPSSRSATTTPANTSCSSFTSFITGFRSLSLRTGMWKPAELRQVSDTAT